MASDAFGLTALLGAGFDAFSVAPGRLPEARALLGRQARAAASEAVREALRSAGAELRARLSSLVGEV
jgi:phosphoenolpyruvate-protein kinase (PTS system EI component)